MHKFSEKSGRKVIESVIQEFEQLKSVNIKKKDEKFSINAEYKKMMTEAMDANHMVMLKIQILSKLIRLLPAQEKNQIEIHESCLDKVENHPIMEFAKFKTYWEVYEELDSFIGEVMVWGQKYLKVCRMGIA